MTTNHVLELGCGHGHNALYLSSKGCIVDAVDFSESALDWAKERAPFLEIFYDPRLLTIRWMSGTIHRHQRIPVSNIHKSESINAYKRRFIQFSCLTNMNISSSIHGISSSITLDYLFCSTLWRACTQC